MDVSPGGTSVPQQQKFHTDDVKSVRNLVGVLIGRHSSYIVLPIVYEWQTKDNRPQRSNVNRVINMTNLLENSQYFSRKRIWVRWSSFAVEHTTMTTSPWPTRRNIKSNKFTITPWLLYLLCKHWFTSSVCNFCHWGADVPPGEISLAAGSNGYIRRLLKSLHFQIPIRPKIRWTKHHQVDALHINL